MTRKRTVVAVAVIACALAAANAMALDWRIEVVDNGLGAYVGRWCGIALDSTGRPHFSYLQSTQYNLWYAYHDGNGWQVEEIDTNTETGEYSAIAMDSNDHPHISYYAISWRTDPDNVQTSLARKLRYATYDGSAWHTETIDQTSRNTGEWTDIVVDANDLPHISYDSAGRPAYVHFDGVDWHKTELGASPSDAGQYTSIALDSTGNPHVSWAQGGYTYDVRYATIDNGAWTWEVVMDHAEVNTYTSIALDSNDDPHMVFYRWREDDLVYAWRNNGTWQTETIETFGSGQYCSLAIDDNDVPHVAYYSEALQDLKYARRIGGSWIIETVDSASMVGEYCDLALDVNGNAHIAYYDAYGELKYATTAIPEPGTLTLMGTLAAAGMALRRRQRR